MKYLPIIFLLSGLFSLPTQAYDPFSYQELGQTAFVSVTGNCVVYDTSEPYQVTAVRADNGNCQPGDPDCLILRIRGPVDSLRLTGEDMECAATLTHRVYVEMVNPTGNRLKVLEIDPNSTAQMRLDLNTDGNCVKGTYSYEAKDRETGHVIDHNVVQKKICREPSHNPSQQGLVYPFDFPGADKTTACLGCPPDIDPWYLHIEPGSTVDITVTQEVEVTTLNGVAWGDVNSQGLFSVQGKDIPPPPPGGIQVTD